MIKTTVITILSLLISLGANSVKSHHRETTGKHQSIKDAPPYLPKVEHIRLITLGFEHFISDIVWFRSISYFGEQLSKKGDIPWLAHMCDLTTELNPKATSRYDFCSSLISWIAKDPQSSVNLLNRAIAHTPNYWRYYYIRGFNYWYFLENKEKAAKDFQKGSTLPDAPPFMASLASKLMSNDPTQAISFLNNLIKNSKDENAIKVLKKNLKLAYVSRDISLLNKAMLKFEQINSRKLTSMQDLVEQNLIAFIPKDPYGKEYYVDKEGSILSREGKKGLEFKGKTAKDGLAKF